MKNACFFKTQDQAAISRDEALACYFLKLLVPVEYDDLTEYVVAVYSDDAYTKFPAKQLCHQLSSLPTTGPKAYRASFFVAVYQLANAVVEERRVRMFGSNLLGENVLVKHAYTETLAKNLVEFPKRLIDPFVSTTVPDALV